MLNKKRVGMTMAAVALVGALTVGGTLAWLSDSTEEVTNTFTSRKNLTIDMKEPAWDGTAFAGETAVKPEAGFGQTLAGNYTPGSEIPKNPQIKNTSAEVPAWVAIEVEYIGDDETSMSQEEFEAAYADLTINTGWKLIGTKDDKQLYMYQTALAVGGKTGNALFDQVTIRSDIQMVEDRLPGFNINLTGYGVQSENVSSSLAETELQKLAGFITE